MPLLALQRVPAIYEFPSVQQASGGHIFCEIFYIFWKCATHTHSHTHKQTPSVSVRLSCSGRSLRNTDALLRSEQQTDKKEKWWRVYICGV